ncbi:Hpt domain-containing protein [Roseovarius sp. MMSF_3281]|uniref:Hpt domain-containing protein n=1 Tax=Roseovarius sp. MMSF_3281 TaxID=3046694 RepID=UPI00273EF8A0|nr:Hpt domain-containing protein [Roseovarius sp. MMSF_3281]
MIDWARVRELRDEIGADSFGEVVELFLDEVEAEIAVLRAGVPTDNLESRLHFLKGSALNLGFAAFTEKCQAGETAAANGAGEAVDVMDILASYDASKIAFLAEIETLSVA